MNTYNQQLLLIKNKWKGYATECCRLDQLLFTLNDVLINENLNTIDDDGFISVIRIINLNRKISEDEIEYIEFMTGHPKIRKYCSLINSYMKQLQIIKMHMQKCSIEYADFTKRRNRKIIDLTK